MGAGTVAAISSITQRDVSQAWGKYFYEHTELYDEIEGLIFSGAHKRSDPASSERRKGTLTKTGEDAIMLYERAKVKIESARVEILNLNHPDLVAPILEIAKVHGLLIR